MEIDKNKVVTHDEMAEPARIYLVEYLVEAEMKVIEGKAKEQVAHGLQDEKLEREAQKLKKEGERGLQAAKDVDDKR